MYIVLISQGYGGYNMSDDFKSLGEAIDYGISNSYGARFQIVKRVNYEIKEIE